MMRFLIPIVLLLATIPPTVADCQMTTSKPDVDSGPTPAGRIYAIEDGCFFGPCFFSMWIYQESNGIDGLQRHDEVGDDTCGGTAGVGDTIVF